jgi:hypothetical protein
MEVQLRELTVLRNQLRELIGKWDASLAQTPRGKRAWLLERWAQDSPEPGKQPAALSSPSKGRRRKSV